MLELLISFMFFSITLVCLTFIFSMNSMELLAATVRADALKIAKTELDSMLASTAVNFDIPPPPSRDEGVFHVVDSIGSLDNFTKEMKVEIFYKILNRKISLSLKADMVSTLESKGQSSCRPSQDFSRWKNPSVSTIDLSSLFGRTIHFSDMDMVGNMLYLSSNSSVASDSDFFIVDMSDQSAPRLLASLNTGPGIISLKIAGDYAYLGNSSINSQLQIVNVTDKNSPRIVSSYKLPGIYKDATTVGNRIFYKAGEVFLGTQKSQIGELHAINVSNPLSPIENSSYEIGNAVNDIFSFKDKVYVATPNNEELKVFAYTSGFLSPFSSFDAPGGSGNGKRLSLTPETLFLGRTLGKDEVFALTPTSSPVQKKFSFPYGASIEGILGYGKLLFILDSIIGDGFGLYDISSPTPERLNKKPIAFSSQPLAFDCDQDTFYVIQTFGSDIIIIKPSL